MLGVTSKVMYLIHMTPPGSGFPPKLQQVTDGGVNGSG